MEENKTPEENVEETEAVIELFGKKFDKKTLYLIVAAAVVAVILIITVCVAVFGKKEEPVALEETPPVTEQEEVIIVVPSEVVEEAQYTEDRKDIVALQEENEDIYAWITIPGTEIDYPVLQSETDNYYLRRLSDGTEGTSGSIYTNAVNAKDFSDFNTVLYGHNMRNGTFFAGLHNFEDSEFFEQNQYIYIYTADRKISYKVCAASAYTDAYLTDAYNFKFSEDANNFLDDLKEYGDGGETNNFGDEIVFDESTRLITLSTCIAGQDENRYLVVGVKEKEELYGE